MCASCGSLTTRSSGRSTRLATIGVIAPPLSASVRLPIVVVHGNGNTRMNSAIAVSLRSRGRRVAVVRGTPSSIQSVTRIARVGLGSAVCGDAGQLRRSHPSPRGSSGSSVRVGGVCRCLGSLAAKSRHSRRLASFEANPSSALGLYARVPSAYGVRIMRQPNYAFERTVKQPRNVRRHRAAAQRER